MQVILARMLWYLDAELLPESQNWINNSKIYFLWEKPALYMNFRLRN